MADGSISIPPYNFSRKQKQPTNSCKLQRETSYIVRFCFSVSLKIYVALKTCRSLFSNIFAYRLTPGTRCGVLILFTDFPTPVTNIPEHLQSPFMSTLCVLHGTFWHYIGTVMRRNYHDYIDNIQNISENIPKSYKIFSASTYFVKIIK